MPCVFEATWFPLWHECNATFPASQTQGPALCCVLIVSMVVRWKFRCFSFEVGCGGTQLFKEKGFHPANRNHSLNFQEQNTSQKHVLFVTTFRISLANLRDKRNKIEKSSHTRQLELWMRAKTSLLALCALSADAESASCFPQKNPQTSTVMTLNTTNTLEIKARIYVDIFMRERRCADRVSPAQAPPAASLKRRCVTLNSFCDPQLSEPRFQKFQHKRKMSVASPGLLCTVHMALLPSPGAKQLLW